MVLIIQKFGKSDFLKNSPSQKPLIGSLFKLAYPETKKKATKRKNQHLGPCKKKIVGKFYRCTTVATVIFTKAQKFE